MPNNTTRLVVLEQNVKSLTTDVQQVAINLEKVVSAMRDRDTLWDRRFSELAERMSASGKMSWPMIAAAGTFLTAMVGLCGTVVAIYVRSQMPDLSPVSKQVDHFEEELARQDARLQLEMRMLNDQVRERVDGRDRVVDAKIDALHSRIDPVLQFVTQDVIGQLQELRSLQRHLILEKSKPGGP